MKLSSGNPIVRNLILVLGVIAVTAAYSAVPNTEIMGVRFANADLFGLNPDVAPLPEKEFRANINELDKQLEEYERQMREARIADSLRALHIADSLKELQRIVFDWQMAEPDSSVSKRRFVLDSAMRQRIAESVSIEDFDTSSTTALNRLAEKLLKQRPVRIAVLGDSFIEGDIFTSDLRRILQSNLGGSGIGFIPCDIPFKIYNKYVYRASKGWKSYSVMKVKSAPENIKDRFIISGYSAIGGPNSQTTWVDKTKNSSADEASIYLIAEQDSKVEVSLGKDKHKQFDLAASKSLRQIHINAPIDSLTFKVLSGSVICYGTRINTLSGVSVDNYSIRSNNGQAVFATSPAINRQYDEMVNYDLIVLQYGLNIMQEGKTVYRHYADQLKDAITYVKRSFPNAAILVLGVSDRWIKDPDTGEFGPIGTAEALTTYQRKAAEESNVCFWNTFAAMQRIGGMSKFISNGWIAADHTHINYHGGNAFAEELADSFFKLLDDTAARLREAELKRIENERLDSIMRANAVLVNPIDSLAIK